MGWGPIGSIAAHQGDLDVHLLAWIQDMLDDLLGLSDWAVVALAGAAILAIPAGLLALYVAQRKRRSYPPEGE